MKTLLYRPAKIWNPPAALKRLLAAPVALAVILLAGALFRFSGLDWDSGRKLHPDERFLITVTNDLEWPASFASYFDPKTSTLSPYSLPKMSFYVYGTLPVYLVKGTAVLLGRDTFDQIPQVGRVLSGVFDLGAVFVLFLTGRRLYGTAVGLLAASLLSLSVLNIQLSHFYTVDTFSNLFVVATVYFLLRAGTNGRWKEYAFAGLMLGLGLSSKLSVATLGMPVLLAAAVDFRRRIQAKASRGDAAEHTLVRLLTIFATAVLVFRVVHPIAFAGPGFWNWSLNPEWTADIYEQGRIVAGNVDLPWVQQWVSRTPLFALSNLVVWGLGLPLGLAAFAGLGMAVFELVRRGKHEHLIPVSYVSVVFIYHAAAFVKFMRYFLPIYPFLALLAAYLIVGLWQRGKAPEELDNSQRDTPDAARSPLAFLRRIPPRPLALSVTAAVLGGTLLYAAAFSSIYSRPHTRIQATRWIYENLPAGANLANEHWDDWLPVGGLDGRTPYGVKGVFKSIQMANYERDTPEKLEKLVENLSKTDYIILSSNRLYDSIPRLPARYPMTSRYYEMLFSGELGFERLVEFTSYPSLLGVALPDQWAEESFHVYDHPKVQIFQKTERFDPEEAKRLLGRGIEWDSVLELTPRKASAAQSGLRLSPSEQRLNSQPAE